MDDRQPYYDEEQSAPKKDNSSTIALIMGILSLVCGITASAPLVGTVLGIIGIVQGNKNRTYDTQAKAGFIMSIIGLVLSSIFFVVAIAIFGFFGNFLFHSMMWPMFLCW